MQPPPERVVEIIRAHARLFDVDGQAVIATTTGGRIEYWNREATRIYGWTEEEVLGRDVVEVTPARISRDAAAAILRRLGAGAVWSGEFVVRRRDGREFAARVHDVPVRDERGEVVGIVGVSAPVPEETSP